MSLKLATATLQKKPFDDLDGGDIFIDSDGDLCVKIDETTEGYNATTLTTGTTFECSGDVEVLPKGTKLEVY